MKQNPRFFGKEFRLSWAEIIMGVGMAMLGLILLLIPNIATSIVICGIGVVGIVIGIIYIVRYCRMPARQAVASHDMAAGLMWLTAGLLLIILKNVLLSLLPVFFGIVLLTGGIAKVQLTLNFRRMQSARWYIELICAAISIIFGALILFNPFSTAMTLMRIIGASLLIEGVQDLLSSYIFKKARAAYFVETQAKDV